MGLLPSDRFGQLLVLLAVAGGAAAYLYNDYVRAPKGAEIALLQQQVDSLHTEIEAAKAELARGSVEDLRRRVDEYRASLVIMRRLVPAQNEVPDLLDDMAARAKLRGVEIAEWQPEAVLPGSPFDTYRYRFEVVGHFDQIGEFLSDVASLDRIIVPFGVIVQEAPQTAQTAYRDTTGSLLQAGFTVRTYVKTSESVDGGTGGAP